MKVNKKISSHCKQLRLPAIGEQVQRMADEAAASGTSYLQFAEDLLEVEIKHRHQKDQERKLKTARLPGAHALRDYDCSLVEGMPAARLEQLKELTWLDQNFNMIVMGPNGIGKSFLAAGLCHHAIEEGYRAYFRPMEQIMAMLRAKEMSKSAMVDYTRLLKAQLLVIDDIMTINMARNEANSFFHFVNALH
jgi:DNA replication protein DnaC